MDEATSALNLLNNLMVDKSCIYTISEEEKDPSSLKNNNKNCKIINFSPNFNIDELCKIISSLENCIFSNLFIFIFEFDEFKTTNDTNCKELEILKESLLIFFRNRPAVVQLTSRKFNKIFTYYKDEKSSEFINIELNSCELKDCKDFPSFFNFFIKSSFVNDKAIEDFEDVLFRLFPGVEDTSVIFKFLRILNLDKYFFWDMVLRYAKQGTKNEFLAMLDISLENDGSLLRKEIQECLSEIDIDNYGSNESVLLSAIKGSNKDIIDFLITNCTHLIQELPLNHQIEITTEVFRKRDFGTLCDLIEFSDFPFPKQFNPEEVEDSRLQQISNRNDKFHDDIEANKMEEISKFCGNNMGLKIVYNTENESALARSLHSDQFEVYVYLKSLGFRAKDFQSHSDILKGTRLKKLNEILTKESVNNAMPNEERSIQLLCVRSFIHNRKICKSIENEFRNKIKKWFKEIYKIKFGSKLLNSAAQCEKLKIIFDFDCDSVANMDHEAPYSSGTTYTVQKWIFIGAKMTNEKNREQYIKGIIAHEICHYVLRLVFENLENPYFKNDFETSTRFEEIVIKYNHWSSKTFGDEIDDECNNIISSMYKLYKKCNYHPELIVRVIEILAFFDNNPEKVKKLEKKYEDLFEFFEKMVLPEIEKLNIRQRESIRKFNNINNVLTELENLDYNFKKVKNVEKVMQYNIILVQCNLPKLFLFEIYLYLREKDANILNARNIFTESSSYNNKEIFENLKEILNETTKLKVIINCSDNLTTSLIKFISGNKNHDFIIIVKNLEDSEKMLNNFKTYSVNVYKEDIYYDWSDLTAQSQYDLLQNKIIFQNIPHISLLDLVSDKKHLGNPMDSNFDDFNDFIDDELFPSMINKSEISMNSKFLIEKDDKNFEALFLPRKFIKVQKNTFELNRNLKCRNFVISQQQLLLEVKDEKYILMSDIAGNGKSWCFKNTAMVLRDLNPTTWISYVDLKLFINNFKLQLKEIEFASFMANKILNVKHNFERKIFKNLYENGKVCILFDGFDEIAPDCSSFVMKLIKSFEHNKGNQLWIATRDYFEVDLEKNLKLNVIYKLNNFTKEDCINLISTNWVMHDFEQQNVKENSLKYNINKIKASPNFEKYCSIAADLSEKILRSKIKTIGAPLFHKMIADIFKNTKNIVTKVTVLKIYALFANIQYERWANDKGEIRKTMSVFSQHNNLNFREIHQLCAMKSLFPKRSSYCDLEFKNTGWKEHEIVACGMINVKENELVFCHETFREYYAADFIIRILMKAGNVTDEFCDFLIKFLTIRKYEVIRIFLNDAFFEIPIQEKITENIHVITKNVYKDIDQLTNLSEIFENNIENLSNLLVEIFKTTNFEDLMEIFKKDEQIVSSLIKNSVSFENFQNYMMNILEIDNLKQMIIDLNFFHHLLKTEINADIVDFFLKELEKKTDFSFMNEVFTLSDENNRSCIQYFIQLNNFDPEIFQIIITYLEKYLTTLELSNLLKQYDNNGWNLLHTCFIKRKVDIVKVFSLKFEDILKPGNYILVFKDLFMQKDIKKFQTPLHLAAMCNEIGFHEILWEILLKIFIHKDELVDIINQKDNDGYGFIHLLIMLKDTSIIKFTFNLLRKELDDFQISKVLCLTGKQSRNLLQIAASHSKVAKTHLFLWRFFQDMFPNSYIKIINETDEYENNVLHIALEFSTSDIFCSIVEELEKFLSKEELRMFLCKLNVYGDNILHCVTRNRYLKLHESLWVTLKKYFIPREILHFIKHLNVNDENFLTTISAVCNKEILNLAWNEIMNTLKNIDDLNENHLEYIQNCNNIIKNKINFGKISNDDHEILKLIWVNKSSLPNIFTSISCNHINQNLPVKDFKDLFPFAFDTSIQNHEVLWKHIDENFQNKNDLESLLYKKTKNDNNFIHVVVKFNNADIINYTLNKIKEKLGNEKFKKMLRSRGQFKENLFHKGSLSKTSFEVYKILFKKFQETFNSKRELLEILKEVDEFYQPFFFLFNSFSTKEAIQYIEQELSTIASRKEIKTLLSCLNSRKENFIQVAISEVESVILYEYLWSLIQKYFDPCEVTEFIRNCDADSSNVLERAIKFNNSFAVKFLWSKIVEIVNTFDSVEKEQISNFNLCSQTIEKFLKGEKINENHTHLFKFHWLGKNSIQPSKLFESFSQLLLKQKISINSSKDLLPFVTDPDLGNHMILWGSLANKFDKQELMNLITQKDKYGRTYIHLLINYNNLDILELTFSKLKQNLDSCILNNILKCIGSKGENLIQFAIRYSEGISVQKFLWKSLQNIFKSDKEFLFFINQVDDFGIDTFKTTVSFGSNEILLFITNEIENIATKEEIRAILCTLCNRKQNILQVAVERNRNEELYESLWKIIRNYFDSSEIIEFIKHFDRNQNNLLLNAFQKRLKSIIKLTWKEIVVTIETNDFVGDTEQFNIKKCEKIIQMFLKSGELHDINQDIFELSWISDNNENSKRLFQQSFLNSNLKQITIEHLKLLLNDEDISSHKQLWKNILNIYKFEDELENFLIQKDKNGNNYIHLILSMDQISIIEYTFKIIQENLRTEQFKQLLKSKGKFGLNLLQASYRSIDVNVHRFLWKVLQSYFEINDEFMEFIEQKDDLGNNFLHLITSYTSGEIIEFAEKELSKKIQNEKIKILMSSLNIRRQNVLQTAIIKKQNLSLFESLWKILKKYFNYSEILEFIKHNDIYGNNSLILMEKFSSRIVAEFNLKEISGILSNFSSKEEHYAFVNQCKKKIHNSIDCGYSKKDEEVLKLDWIKSDNFEPFKIFDDVPLLLTKGKIVVKSINDLLPFISDKRINSHKILWEHVLKMHNTEYGLKTLLNDKGEFHENFIYLLVKYNISNIVEFTFDVLRKSLKDKTFSDILNSRSEKNESLLEVAIHSDDKNVFRTIWKVFYKSYNTDKDFVKFLQKLNENNCNIIFDTLSFGSDVILKFIITELERIATNEDIKFFLMYLNYRNQNLLQVAAAYNKNLNLHKILWEIVFKYFKDYEIIQFIKNEDVKEYNVFQAAIHFNSNLIVNFTWDQIVKFINQNNLIKEREPGDMMKCEKIIKKIINRENISSSEKSLLSLRWIICKQDNEEKEKLFNRSCQSLLKSLNNYESFNKIFSASYTDFPKHTKIEDHEFFWKQIFKQFKLKEELKNSIINSKMDKNNYLHLLVTYNYDNVINITLKMLKENFNQKQFNKIIIERNCAQKSLLQISLFCKKDLSTFKTLWKYFQSSFETDEEFINCLDTSDELNGNVLHSIVTYVSKDIFTFFINEIEKNCSRDKLRDLLKTLGTCDRNLLQAAARQNTNLKLHESLWHVFQEYFESNELLEFIKHNDIFENNLLSIAFKNNSTDVINLTWNQIVETITKSGIHLSKIQTQKFDECCEFIKQNSILDSKAKDNKKIMKLDWLESKNIFFEFLPFKSVFKITNGYDNDRIAERRKPFTHEVFWYYTLKRFVTGVELFDFMTKADEFRENRFHYFIDSSDITLIKFACKILKNKLTKDQFKNLLKSKGEDGRNTIQYMAYWCKTPNKHEFIWSLLSNECDSIKEFMSFMKEEDFKGNNPLHIVVNINYLGSYKVIETMIKLTEKLISRNEAKELLKSVGAKQQNLLQLAVYNLNHYNGSTEIEMYEMVWKLFRLYLETDEIRELIYHRNQYNNHVFHIAVSSCSSDDLKLVWKEIENYLTIEERIKYLSMKSREVNSIYDRLKEKFERDKTKSEWLKIFLKNYAPE